MGDLIFSDGNTKVYWPEIHKLTDQKYYRQDYAPQKWGAMTPYTEGMEVICPAQPNGCMYTCLSGGKSSTLEPTNWSTVSGDITMDGAIEWLCRPYSTILRPGDAITTSTWTGDIGVVLDNMAIVDSGTATKVRVTAVPTGVKQICLTNSAVITRLNGDIETIDRSIYIKLS
jgi:hypothetical protein